uniref:(California timema) hypothetical protein n=1 Tax=Timema californicum TaxID=61474 RepID=A0A7R9JKJ4_TIMCA|nr:unnamed protein product [Timema californicum]
MEMASYCFGKVKQITVIGSIPFHRSFVKEIGTQVQRFFDSKGVEFLLDTTPQSLKSIKNYGAVQQVCMQTNVKDVYAVGDAVFGPVLGTKTNIGHWRVAQYHGKVAAKNMLLKPTVPFFWTRFINMSIRYVEVSCELPVSTKEAMGLL